MAAHAADGVRVANHHQPIGGAGQAEVEPFAGSLARAVLVDAQDACAAVYALWSEGLAVEHVVARPEAPLGIEPRTRGLKVCGEHALDKLL